MLPPPPAAVHAAGPGHCSVNRRSNDRVLGLRRQGAVQSRNVGSVCTQQARSLQHSTAQHMPVACAFVFIKKLPHSTLSTVLLLLAPHSRLAAGTQQAKTLQHQHAQQPAQHTVCRQQNYIAMEYFANLLTASSAQSCTAQLEHSEMHLQVARLLML